MRAPARKWETILLVNFNVDERLQRSGPADFGYVEAAIAIASERQTSSLETSRILALLTIAMHDCDGVSRQARLCLRSREPDLAASASFLTVAWRGTQSFQKQSLFQTEKHNFQTEKHNRREEPGWAMPH